MTSCHGTLSGVLWSGASELLLFSILSCIGVLNFATYYLASPSVWWPGPMPHTSPCVSARFLPECPLAAWPRVVSTAPGTYTTCLSLSRTVLFNTVHKPWADVIPCTYEMKHTLKELIRVKAFLLAGTTVSIVEEKVSRPGVFGHSLAGGFCVCVFSNVPLPHHVVTSLPL